MRFNGIPRGILYVIIDFFLVIKVTYSMKGNDSALCGTLILEPETVTECQSARLTYTPYRIKTHRIWAKEDHMKKKLIDIYNYQEKYSGTKYFESGNGVYFTLTIASIDLRDNGSYIVDCGDSYSERKFLIVTPKSAEDCKGECGELTVNNQNIIEGDKFTFVFKVSPGINVTWEKKLWSTFEQVTNDQYNISFNTDQTVHRLAIMKSQYGDRGDFRVNCGANVSNSIYLNIVRSPPSDPEFSNVVYLDTCKPKGCLLAELNTPVTIECFVKGGSNPIDLNILKKGIKQSNVIRTCKNTTTVSYNYVKYRFTPTKFDDDVKFKCTVKNPALLVKSTTYVMLYIIRAPETIETNSIEEIEGTETDVQCIERSVRPRWKSKLYVNHTIERNTSMKYETTSNNLFDVTTSTTRLLTRFDNQIKILCCNILDNKICEAANITVLFSPRTIRVTDVAKQNQDNGDTEIKLKCSVAVSNPKSFVNMRGAENVSRTLIDTIYEQKPDSHGWTLTMVWVFNFTRYDNEREISFEVKTDGFPDLKLVNDYRLNITYSPIVTMTEPDKFAHIGENVSLTCHVDSNPPSTISWYNDAGLIKSVYGTGNFDIHLTHVTADNFQKYTCTAQNGIGGIILKNTTLIVKVSSNGPMNNIVLELILSISGVVLVAAVFIIVFIRYRRRNNTSLHMSTQKDIEIEEHNENQNEKRVNNTRQQTHESLNIPDETMETKFCIIRNRPPSRPGPSVYDNVELK